MRKAVTISLTHEKKTKRVMIFSNTKAILRGSRRVCLDHFRRMASLLFNDNSEKLCRNGHFESKQSHPHSKSVPTLLDRNFSTNLTINTPLGWHLFTISSATYSIIKSILKIQQVISSLMLHLPQSLLTTTILSCDHLPFEI